MTSLSSDAQTSPLLADGVVCKANISLRGRRRRRGFGFVLAAGAVGLLGVSVATSAPWFWRALVGLPAALSAIGFLQARRNTCIARASEGTFEHDDFSKTAAPAEEVAASREVSAGIRRDAALVGLGAAVLGVATAMLR